MQFTLEFIFQSEAPLMIRPFLKDMTKSELHAVCTGGFATIAGSVMAAYILMKVLLFSYLVYILNQLKKI